ncbi:MAG: 3-deoxy-D-manno-octulosonate 8-phosphate phosphatase, YrbI family [Bacteroidetes bacterium]|jgi:YrbI family 3-deoxy-D-manno-octulosonate 8-phosphate phosphatase|nr:3-deoxy-D-manno-octulosonate 8-phosphate phosphatase, YrbI family [Bacteroidota bacterium]
MKTIAFIPVRGGSKSIPLKNIKVICGKPLVYWCASALQKSAKVDEIIIATDSDEIEKTVNSFGFSKLKVYRRSNDNSTDTASTESVMLEYIEKNRIMRDSVFMLVQATSPLTQAKHFDEALSLYESRMYDSILTCVRNYRFFWNADGTSKNYNYKHRPRRQDFDGELMENGAFYINKTGNIVDSGNRLSGKIGIYEMPSYMAVEIDEPEDWAVMEGLIRKHIVAEESKSNIMLVLSDVDGVLTDAGMYYSETGDELKKFNTHDGMGFQLLRNAGFKTGIITSENTKIVENRARKLKVDYLHQGKNHEGKLSIVQNICNKDGYSLQEIAYIGDDVNCLELLSAVGFAACPSDAVQKIKSIPGIHILSAKGGEGVFREFAEKIILEKGIRHV